MTASGALEPWRQTLLDADRRYALEVLEKRFPGAVPGIVVLRINAETDRRELERWAKVGGVARTMEAFQAVMYGARFITGGPFVDECDFLREVRNEVRQDLLIRVIRARWGHQAATLLFRRINEQQDPATLYRWFDLALSAFTLDEIQAALGRRDVAIR
jgi:hypothetical protein